MAEPGLSKGKRHEPPAIVHPLPEDEERLVDYARKVEAERSKYFEALDVGSHLPTSFTERHDDKDYFAEDLLDCMVRSTPNAAPVRKAADSTQQGTA